MAEKKEEQNSFYSITPLKSGVEVEIFHNKLVLFLSEHLGYGLYVDYTDSYMLVKITDNSIVEEAKIIDIKQDVKQYLLSRNASVVLDKIIRGNIISENLIQFLPKISEINFNISTNDKAYLYYSNAIVRITANGGSLIDYQDFKGKVWKGQINRRKISPSQKETSVFEKFLNLICNSDLQRLSSLCSIIGYLLSPYKDPSISKAVILIDENVDFSGKAHGGTGKGIIATALENITPTVTKDGKKYNPKEVFAFDDIRPFHRLLYFDDVKKDFPFEEFYSLITGKLKANRKYKDSVTIPYSLSPKLLISTNYMVKGSGGQTDERRRIEFEIAPYFSQERSPKDEFGHILFDDWGEGEWERFDFFMIKCVAHYLKNGIINPPNINLKLNKLISNTDSEFISFMEEFEDFGKQVSKRALYNKFIEEYPQKKMITIITFRRWIDEWASYHGYEFMHMKSNSKSFVIIVRK